MSDDRITIESGKRFGQPCIRGLRITVWDVLGWLAAGMTQEQILADYPELEAADFLAVFGFAARLGRRNVDDDEGVKTDLQSTGETRRG